MFTQSIESGLPASLCVPTHRCVLLTRLSIVLSRETKDRIDQSPANTISSPSLIILHQPSAHCEPGIPPASCCLGSTRHALDLQRPALRNAACYIILKLLRRIHSRSNTSIFVLCNLKLLNGFVMHSTLF